MFPVASYELSTVFAAMELGGSRRRLALPDGRKFRGNSSRLILFKLKGTTCVTCGIQGSVFILETHSLELPPHLNLYAVKDDGGMVLITKDHIFPRSRGGKNEMDNYATMCQPCNEAKSDKVTES